MNIDERINNLEGLIYWYKVEINSNYGHQTFSNLNRMIENRKKMKRELRDMRILRQRIIKIKKINEKI